jgi:hypothetical protein
VVPELAVSFKFYGIDELYGITIFKHKQHKFAHLVVDDDVYVLPLKADEIVEASGVYGAEADLGGEVADFFAEGFCCHLIAFYCGAAETRRAAEIND